MVKETKWLEVSIAVSADDVVRVVPVMDKYGYGGSVIEEEHDKYDRKTFVVKAYLPSDRHLGRRKKELEQEARGVLLRDFELNFRFTAPQEWLDGWKAFFRPFRIGRRLIIKPSWEDYSPSLEKVIIEIDPGMAFGTGHHATTRLCLVALEDRQIGERDTNPL